MRFEAPSRIDLAGGTLDIAPLHYFFDDCITLNLAVDLSVAVSLESNGQGRLITQNAAPQPLSKIPLYALALDYLKIEEAIDVRVQNSIPKAAGLGGSSSLLVALVAALSHAKHGGATHESVLQAVTALEHRLLGKPAGTQDAIAAAFGGLSEIQFQTGQPKRVPLPIPDFLQGPLFLAYSRTQHHSGMNNWEIIKAACEGDSAILDAFSRLNENSHLMRQALLTADRAAFTVCLQAEAQLRRELCPGLWSPPMAQFAQAIAPKAISKVCGAGGGGCMFLFGDNLDPEILTRTAEKYQLQILTVRASASGCNGLSL